MDRFLPTMYFQWLLSTTRSLQDSQHYLSGKKIMHWPLKIHRCLLFTSQWSPRIKNGLNKLPLTKGIQYIALIINLKAQIRRYMRDIMPTIMIRYQQNDCRGVQIKYRLRENQLRNCILLLCSLSDWRPRKTSKCLMITIQNKIKI